MLFSHACNGDEILRSLPFCRKVKHASALLDGFLMYERTCARIYQDLQWTKENLEAKADELSLIE